MGTYVNVLFGNFSRVSVPSTDLFGWDRSPELFGADWRK